MDITKVVVGGNKKDDILKVIPSGYSLDELLGMGFVITDKFGVQVGSCKITDENERVLTVYAFKSTKAVREVFIRAFKLLNNCEFVEKR